MSDNIIDFDQPLFDDEQPLSNTLTYVEQPECGTLQKKYPTYNLVEVMNTPKIHRKMVINGLQQGTVGSWISLGGVGKSFLAMELAISVANPNADRYLGGFFRQGNLPKPGKVLYFNAEDPADEVHNRFRAISERLPPEITRSLEGLIDIPSGYGEFHDLGHLEPGIGFNDNYEYIYKPQNSYNLEVMTIAYAYQGYKLIIFDTLSRFHSLEENNTGDMGILVKHFEYIAKQSGAAVLFLHHANKSSSREDQSDSQYASRGSSLLTANIRYSASLQVMSPSEAKDFDIPENKRKFYMRYCITKQNYGLPEHDRWFERLEGGVLRHVDLVKIDKSNQKNQKGNQNGRNQQL
jgi:RecA-family ATPase